MANPCCAKCGSTNIIWQTRTFSSIAGVLVYCGDCGAIISWTPKSK